MSTPDRSGTAPDLANALDLGKEIERLANQYFSGVPGPVVAASDPGPGALAAQSTAPELGATPPMPPHVRPHALNVGAGGMSPLVTVPPVPGWAHRPPLAATPMPKESDLRPLQTLGAEHGMLASPLATASEHGGKGGDAGLRPYFMDIAGPPAVDATPTPARAPALPGVPPRTAHKPAATDAIGSYGPASPEGDTVLTPRAAAPTETVEMEGVPTALPSTPRPPGATYLPDDWSLPQLDLKSLGTSPAPVAEQIGVPAVSTLAGDPFAATRLPQAMELAEGRAPVRGASSSIDRAPVKPTGPTYVPGMAETARVADAAQSKDRPGAVSEEAVYGFRPELVAVEPQRGMFDPHALKRDFPILQERAHGRQLVWLDNAATTQKPHAVIERLSYFYRHENSNVHRAAHTLAARATDAYEAARDKVRRFINAGSPKQIVFVRGTTEGINLVAKSWGRRNVREGDEIVITWLEHHANIVPWQQLCSETGCRLRVAPVDDRGEVILEEYEKLLNPKTRLVSFSMVSNALGTIVPAREMVKMAHRHGALVHIDGAQAVSHMPVDVQALDCDFFCFSGHKVFAPTGIGVVYGKQDLLEAMPPWQGGGNMIQDVTFERTTYQPPPQRFEAGTGNIADAVGLGAALDWVTSVGIENIQRYEHELLEYGTARLLTVPGLTLIGCARDKAGVLSFVLDGIRTEDIGGLLDLDGIAVRSGHHCAQPILRRFGLEATVRASLAPYNTKEDLDALVASLLRLQAGRPTRLR